MKPESKTKPRPKAPSVTNSQQELEGQERLPSPRLTKKDAMHGDAVEVDQPKSFVNGQSGHSGTNAFSESKTRKELDRWKQKATDVRSPLFFVVCSLVTQAQLEAQRDALSKQLEELFQIRRTEPEQLLEQLQTQYEERAKSTSEHAHQLYLITGFSTGSAHQGVDFPVGPG